jgi:hypothetical protein
VLAAGADARYVSICRSSSSMTTSAASSTTGATSTPANEV